jgi:transposase
MKALLTAQQINKTDRNDARGIAQMMRVGLFKPVHVKTLIAQEQRMLLTSRKLLQRKLLDLECELRGTLRNFGLKVASLVALDTRHASASSSWAFLVWRRLPRRCSTSAGSCASSSPSCIRCCSTRSAMTRCADG